MNKVQRQLATLSQLFYLEIKENDPPSLLRNFRFHLIKDAGNDSDIDLNYNLIISLSQSINSFIDKILHKLDLRKC